MGPAGKISGFRRDGDDWFCSSSLPSDITVVVDEVNFHLHKFPLISRCGKILTDLNQSQTTTDKSSKAHPWLPDKDREQLFSCIDLRKLSLDACAHATQNKRLPVRTILQVLFFEQIHLRTALASCLNVLDTESAPATSSQAGQRVQRDRGVTVVRENQFLKVDMERMRSRVGELEKEFGKIKEEMKEVSK